MYNLHLIKTEIPRTILTQHQLNNSLKKSMKKMNIKAIIYDVV